MTSQMNLMSKNNSTEKNVVKIYLVKLFLIHRQFGRMVPSTFSTMGFLDFCARQTFPPYCVMDGIIIDPKYGLLVGKLYD